MRLEKKRVIVTGAAGGIGGKICEYLIREGAVVAGFDINEKLGKALEETFNQGERQVFQYQNCNVGSKEETDRAVEKAAAFLGGVDALVHTAAIHQNCMAEDCTEEHINRTMKINFNGTIYMNQAVLNKMKTNPAGGTILNFSSLDSLTGPENGAVYAASKAAVATWTRTIATEWAKAYRIRCNSILPTAMTPLYQEYLDSFQPEERAAFQAEMSKKIPLGGAPGKPEDIANYIVFLVSDEANFVNGALIEIDGGQCMLRG